MRQDRHRLGRLGLDHRDGCLDLHGLRRAVPAGASSPPRARPARPRRWTLPITAFRVTPPSCAAILLALCPSSHSRRRSATRSSVQPRPASIIPLRPLRLGRVLAGDDMRSGSPGAVCNPALCRRADRALARRLSHSVRHPVSPGHGRTLPRRSRALQGQPDRRRRAPVHRQWRRRPGGQRGTATLAPRSDGIVTPRNSAALSSGRPAKPERRYTAKLVPCGKGAIHGSRMRTMGFRQMSLRTLVALGLAGQVAACGSVPRTPYTADRRRSPACRASRARASTPTPRWRRSRNSRPIRSGAPPGFTYLALSGGGGDGAYGAGVLNGWTASGKRPEFTAGLGRLDRRPDRALRVPGLGLRSLPDRVLHQRRRRRAGGLARTSPTCCSARACSATGACAT